MGAPVGNKNAAGQRKGWYKASGSRRHLKMHGQIVKAGAHKAGIRKIQSQVRTIFKGR